MQKLSQMYMLTSASHLSCQETVSAQGLNLKLIESMFWHFVMYRVCIKLILPFSEQTSILVF